MVAVESVNLKESTKMPVSDDESSVAMASYMKDRENIVAAVNADFENLFGNDDSMNLNDALRTGNKIKTFWEKAKSVCENPVEIF